MNNLHKKTHWSRTALALALWCGAGAALAQQPASALAQDSSAQAGAGAAKLVAPQQPITMEEYLRLVVQNQPHLAADRLELGLAQADTRTASAFPNPTASFGRKPGEREWSIEQPLPIFGQRGLRIEHARKGEVTASANVDVAVSTTMADAAHSFIELLLAQQRLSVWNEARQELDTASRVVRGQIEAGTRSRYDGARLNLQLAQMAVQVSKAQAEVQEAASKAAAMAALPHWSARVTGSLMADSGKIFGNFDSLWGQAQLRLPVVRAALAEMDQARQKITLEKREALPTPSVSLARVRNHFDGNYNQVGVSVELPLFDRNRGAIDRAQVEASQAQLRHEATLLAAQSELQRALTQLQMRRASVQGYETEGLAQIAPLRQMAQDAYQLGQGSILELIDALSSITEHRLEHLELVKDMLEAEWDVRVASGDLPQVQP